MKRATVKENFALTIFGASGDLAKIKIFPALFELAWQKRLPENYVIYGYARSAKTDAEFREEFAKSVKDKFGDTVDQKILDEMLKKVFYFTGGYDAPEDYEKFFKELESKCQNNQTKFIFYYSTPPTAFNDITRNLAKHKNDRFSICLEKPFGGDEATAKDMFAILEEYFDENQVYLLDHYLGKESVQSITSMRYANSIINHLLKGELIKYIQITGIEDIGIKERGKYFDEVGIIKDMIQSHLLQLLALVTMSMPNSLNYASVHREKYHILSALKFDPENFLAKGQYESYKNENGIKKDSTTETFAAIKLCIDQTEWAQVPIYIRTGKRVNRKHTYITIVFKKLHFQESIEGLKHNKLIIELQPKANVYFKITNKRGGTYEEFHQMAEGQSLECFGDDCLPEHGRLILDVLKGERMHFLSFNEVLACWKFIDTVLAESKKQNLKLEIYEDGSNGPEGQDKLLQKEGHVWHEI